jgi:hypothetical protein
MPAEPRNSGTVSRRTISLNMSQTSAIQETAPPLLVRPGKLAGGLAGEDYAGRIWLPAEGRQEANCSSVERQESVCENRDDRNALSLDGASTQLPTDEAITGRKSSGADEWPLAAYCSAADPMLGHESVSAFNGCRVPCSHENLESDERSADGNNENRSIRAYCSDNGKTVTSRVLSEGDGPGTDMLKQPQATSATVERSHDWDEEEEDWLVNGIRSVLKRNMGLRRLPVSSPVLSSEGNFTDLSADNATGPGATSRNSQIAATDSHSNFYGPFFTSSQPAHPNGVTDGESGRATRSDNSHQDHRSCALLAGNTQRPNSGNMSGALTNVRATGPLMKPMARKCPIAHTESGVNKTVTTATGSFHNIESCEEGGEADGSASSKTEKHRKRRCSENGVSTERVYNEVIHSGSETEHCEKILTREGTCQMLAVAVATAKSADANGTTIAPGALKTPSVSEGNRSHDNAHTARAGSDVVSSSKVGVHERMQGHKQVEDDSVRLNGCVYDILVDASGNGSCNGANHGPVGVSAQCPAQRLSQSTLTGSTNIMEGVVLDGYVSLSGSGSDQRNQVDKRSFPSSGGLDTAGGIVSQGQPSSGKKRKMDDSAEVQRILGRTHSTSTSCDSHMATTTERASRNQSHASGDNADDDWHDWRLDMRLHPHYAWKEYSGKKRKAQNRNCSTKNIPFTSSSSLASQIRPSSSSSVQPSIIAGVKGDTSTVRELPPSFYHAEGGATKSHGESVFPSANTTEAAEISVRTRTISFCEIGSGCGRKQAGNRDPLSSNGAPSRGTVFNSPNNVDLSGKSGCDCDLATRENTATLLMLGDTTLMCPVIHIMKLSDSQVEAGSCSVNDTDQCSKLLTAVHAPADLALTPKQESDASSPNTFNISTSTHVPSVLERKGDEPFGTVADSEELLEVLSDPGDIRLQDRLRTLSLRPPPGHSSFRVRDSRYRSYRPPGCRTGVQRDVVGRQKSHMLTATNRKFLSKFRRTGAGVLRKRPRGSWTQCYRSRSSNRGISAVDNGQSGVMTSLRVSGVGGGDRGNFHSRINNQRLGVSVSCGHSRSFRFRGKTSGSDHRRGNLRPFRWRGSVPSGSGNFENSPSFQFSGRVPDSSRQHPVRTVVVQSTDSCNAVVDLPD